MKALWELKHSQSPPFLFLLASEIWSICYYLIRNSLLLQEDIEKIKIFDSKCWSYSKKITRKKIHEYNLKKNSQSLLCSRQYCMCGEHTVNKECPPGSLQILLTWTQERIFNSYFFPFSDYMLKREFETIHSWRWTPKTFQSPQMKH